jgi:hypothetical protein
MSISVSTPEPCLLRVTDHLVVRAVDLDAAG